MYSAPHHQPSYFLHTFDRERASKLKMVSSFDTQELLADSEQDKEAHAVAMLVRAFLRARAREFNGDTPRRIGGVITNRDGIIILHLS